MRSTLSVVSLLVAASASLLAQPVAPVRDGDASRSGVAVIRNGDVFDMRLGGVPTEVAAEFSAQYSVGPEGTVNLPLIGEMKVVGRTPTQVERAIQEKMVSDKLFTHPTVMIFVSERRFVSVGGAVRAPQRLQWTNDLTLATAIENAGGPDDYADLRGVRLIRDGKIVNRYDLRVVQKDPSRDPKLLPGDQVFVPKSFP